VLKLRGATAYDVMLPRADIIALPADLSFDQALDFIKREGHSRYPVYAGQLDDVVGMVHIKDIIAQLGRSEDFSLRAVLRKPLLVVPSVPVLDLLLRMRQERMHMALVVDEYGGIDGIITIEDLVETIVGDISDEHDELAAPQMTERAEGVLELDARTPVEAFEERMGQVLTEEERAADIDTVGGLVFTLAGRVPARGEIFSHSSGLEFRVLDADARRIRRLRVRRTPAPAPDGTRRRSSARRQGSRRRRAAFNAPMRLFQIPLGLPFLPAIARGTIERFGTGEQLASAVILLPTQRSARALRDAFLTASGSDALLLPRMRALAGLSVEDADELALPALLKLPPAVEPLRRQAVLARFAARMPRHAGGPPPPSTPGASAASWPGCWTRSRWRKRTTSPTTPPCSRRNGWTGWRRWRPKRWPSTGRSPPPSSRAWCAPGTSG
jgi:Mg2+/Co2+ transporter CorC